MDLKLSPVCRKQPNPWGLFDILGNASEWMDNNYTGFGLAWGEGKDGPLVDPMGASMDKYDGRRSMKSGNFLLPACASRAADHDGALDYTRDLTSGFRPVRTLFERGGA
jgi:formylglycine-generating enzyme required for sulfatase activity